MNMMPQLQIPKSESRNGWPNVRGDAETRRPLNLERFGPRVPYFFHPTDLGFRAGCSILHPVRFAVLLAWTALLLAGGSSQTSAAALRTENVILITADGLRWQEVFRGAEKALMNKQYGSVADTNALLGEFWRESAEERRRVLLPFLWSQIARDGQLFGNQDKGSVVRVTNGRNFSYPGYSEILCGFPDSRIDSNDKKPNPNTNVLEWLNSRPAFRGKVAAFGCWDVFPSILNRDRAGFPIQAGWEIVDRPNPRREAVLRVLRATPRVWDGVIYDSFMFEAAMEHFVTAKPRVLYLAFGETDDWAHDGRYDLHLKAARGFDGMIEQLWKTVQQDPAYRDKTTLLITTDHGRGTGTASWKDHGEKTPESAFIWVAALGPDTPAKGERTGGPELTQGQIAATVAALLGQDFRAASPKAARAIAEVIDTSTGQK